MRLLLDQGLPRGAVALLTAADVDAAHVGDIGLGAALDGDILAFARDGGRLVVTLDADFHALMALSGATSPSVVRLRVEGLRAEPLVALLLRVLTLCGPALDKGALVTVARGRVRVRHLPLVR